jgi:hypothetical protein
LNQRPQFPKLRLCLRTEEKPLPVSQSKFISLAEAAKLTGYHQDYLGQLARAGKLNAQKIGRNWATTLEAVKLLDPQIVVPESHAETLIEEPKIETNVETPGVSLAEHQALQEELKSLKADILKREEEQKHDQIYTRKSSFEEEARTELLPTLPVAVPSTDATDEVFSKDMKAEVLPKKDNKVLNDLKIATAVLFIAAFSVTAVTIIYFTYIGYVPPPVKNVANSIFHYDTEISGASNSR